MAIYIPESEQIYFPKTRAYFEEVLSSYANGNYRSAIVMLYSIAICDILLKLQELKDMFNDPIAKEILREVNEMRNAHDNKSKSRWEKELIESVYRKTKLLDLESYTNLNHLYDHRNFSAHPALNENYELITPSKETTIAHIKNTLTNILVKPPIFIKNITDVLTEDLKEKKGIYQDRHKELSVYLNNRYFQKMPESMKLATLRSFWKFCFCSPDNKDCTNNRIINRMALEILIDSIPKESIVHIKENPNVFVASTDDTCMLSLALMLSRHIELYPALSRDLKLQIDMLIERNLSAKMISWFKFSSFKEHMQMLQDISNINSDPVALKLLINHYSDSGELTLLTNYFIEYFGRSQNFDTADQRFEMEIRPFLNQMTRSQIEKLLEAVNKNNQIYSRNRAYSTNTEIAERVKTIWGNDFDYTPYPNFKFDREILTKTSESAGETSDHKGIVLSI